MTKKNIIHSPTPSSQTSRLRSVWIACVAVYYVAETCFISIYKYLLGKTNRPWVNHMIQRWTKQMLALVNVHCKIYNPYHVKPIKGQRTIIMCNHSSHFDIPISFKAFHNYSIRMLAKKEFSRFPIMGKGMHAAEFPFVDRKNRMQAIKDLAYAKTLMESGIALWIAPEGTRSKDGQLKPFKKGGFIMAIQSGATIIPAGIRGANKILPAGTSRFCLNQIAEPIDASKYTMENKDVLIQKVYDTIHSLISEPCA